MRPDPTRLPRDVSQVADGVVQRLLRLDQAGVEVHLGMHARIPDDAPDGVVRTVTENSRTLKLASHGCEEG